MPPKSPFKNLYITYPATLLARWKAGQLIREWGRRHKDLFDEGDFNLAWNQRRSGRRFAEWFAAIHYRKQGYR
ncbi:MAG TPA: hypothetical protein VLB32_08650, partial [Candidatus Acidoferrales bacterium]|nr:hypothetical protein [Candidatus Acidoferrales bacterium]